MQCITIVFLLKCFWSAECSVWDGSLLRVKGLDGDTTSIDFKNWYSVKNYSCTSLRIDL